MRQWSIVALCCLLNAFDGYDVLSISFAAPGIARDWGVPPAALGVVLSIELIGMAAGAVFLGQLADRLGRRPVLIAATSLVALGMACSAGAGGVVALALFRLATGIGLGGILAVTPSVSAEFSSARHRDLSVALTSGGYPLGAFAGGAVAASLVGGGWHHVFLFGSIATACLVPFIWWLVPETPAFILQRRPVNALEQINRVLERVGQRRLESLPPQQEGTARAGIRALFAPGLARTTMLLVAAYLAHVSTVYFITKWTPKIVVDLGYTAVEAGSVLVWNSAGGTLGSILFSLAMRIVSPTRGILFALILSAVAVAAFGLAPPELSMLRATAFVAGIGLSATIVIFYAILIRGFPPSVRSSGVGFVVGVGRAGSSLSPMLAGILFSLGAGRTSVSLIMASGSLIALICLLILWAKPQAVQPPIEEARA